MNYKATRNWENANKMIFEGYGVNVIPTISWSTPDSFAW